MKKILLIVAGTTIISALIVIFVLKNDTSKKSTQTLPTEVTWELRESNIWKPTGTPPACADPFTLTSPVDISKVTAILYPGQVRGDAYKPHGAFRFSEDSNNQVIVTVPFDAQIIRGSRAFRNGENQYSFEFIVPCGIWYSFGHLLELSPKFLEIANKLPLVDDDAEGFHVQQFYDVRPPVAVKTGEVIATAVGYAKQKNVFVDFGVLDLRHKNGNTIRSEWAAKYSPQFDEYAVCWMDLLPAVDREHLRSLFGSGDVESGVKSDYCHYPENK